MTIQHTCSQSESNPAIDDLEKGKWLSRQLSGDSFLLLRQSDDNEEVSIAILSSCNWATANEIASRMRIADHTLVEAGILEPAKTPAAQVQYYPLYNMHGVPEGCVDFAYKTDLSDPTKNTKVEPFYFAAGRFCIDCSWGDHSDASRRLAMEILQYERNSHQVSNAMVDLFLDDVISKLDSKSADWKLTSEQVQAWLQSIEEKHDGK